MYSSSPTPGRAKRSFQTCQEWTSPYRLARGSGESSSPLHNYHHFHHHNHHPHAVTGASGCGFESKEAGRSLPGGGDGQGCKGDIFIRIALYEKGDNYLNHYHCFRWLRASTPELMTLALTLVSRYQPNPGINPTQPNPGINGAKKISYGFCCLGILHLP